MADLLSRIRRRIDMTTKDFQSDMHFSPRLAMARMCANLCGRAGLRSVAAAAGRKKEEFVHKEWRAMNSSRTKLKFETLNLLTSTAT